MDLWAQIRKLPPWFWGVAGAGGLVLALAVRGRGSGPASPASPVKPEPVQGPRPALISAGSAGGSADAAIQAQLASLAARVDQANAGLGEAAKARDTLERVFSSGLANVMGALGGPDKATVSGSALAGGNVGAGLSASDVASAVTMTGSAMPRVPDALRLAPSFNQPVGGVKSGVNPQGQLVLAAQDTSAAAALARKEWAKEHIAETVEIERRTKPDYSLGQFLKDVPDAYWAIEYQRASRQLDERLQAAN